jgi:hypothetical protein
MARKSSQDQLKDYNQRLETSKRWRKEEGYDAMWRRLVDLYRGRQYDYYSDEDRLLVNVVFATVNVIAPSISVNYPKITVNSVNHEDAAKAVIAEAVVNYWWRFRDIRSEFRRSVKDFVMFGHGWMKVGYRFVEEEAVGNDADISDADVEGNEGTPNTVILTDSPFAERVSPFDIFVDPDATSMHDIKWIAQRIRRPLKEVKSDKRYNRLAREDAAPMTVGRYADDPSRKKVNDKTYGYAEIWEYYDVTNKSMSVFCAGGEQFLVKPIKMPYSFGHPFVMMRNYDVPDYFYPIGDLEQIEPMQRELNETRTQMMNHRKRFARKYLYKESAFDQLGRTALESQEDNVMVPVISDEPLTSVIAPMPAVINPPEFYNQSELITGDIDRISGVTEYQRGGTPEIRRTATEANLLQDAANARTADKLATVELAISEVGRRMVALAHQFMSGEQVARVMGKDGEPLWVQYDREYLEGDFDFEVVGGSTQPHNESFRRQSALQLVDAMAPFVQTGLVNMKELASYVLQNGFGIKNPEIFMAAPEQPMGPEAPQGPPQGPQGAPMGPGGGMPPMQAGPPPDGGGMPPEMMAALQGMQGQPPI